MCDTVDIGETIRTYRLRHGLSQSDLGELLGLTSQGLSAIERGLAHIKPERVAGLRDSHPKLWQDLANALLASTAERLGVDAEDVTAVHAHLSREEIEELSDMLDRLRAQEGESQ